MSTGQKFPIAVKCGSSIVKIYRNKPKNGYCSFTVRYYRGGEEVRLTRANLEDAQTEAQTAARCLANGELDVLSLRNDDRRVYIQAVENLKDTGVGLETATREYAEALAILNGGSLLEAIRIHVQQAPQFCQPKNVAEVVSELVQQKIEKGRDAVYVKDLRNRLNRFAASFNCPVSSVSTELIEKFLLQLKLSGRSQNNFRRVIGTLFRFAIKRRYVPKDHAGITGVERATERPNEIEIFSPDEMTQLLTVAQPEIIPFLALGAFAGLRYAELLRLGWEDINIQEGHIEVKAKNAKTRVRRLIPIARNLGLWLAPCAKPSGPVASYANMTKQLSWLSEAARVDWLHNGLRHSYVSYRTAETSDIFAGVFQPKRTVTNMGRHTGLYVQDLDDLQDIEEVEIRIRADSSVFAEFMSISHDRGEGESASTPLSILKLAYMRDLCPTACVKN